MNPFSHIRSLLFAVLIALGLLGLPGGSWARELPAEQLADVTPVPSTDLPAVPWSGVAEAPSGDAIKQAYDLLLDRYVQPPAPNALLAAAYDGVVKGLGEAGVTVKSSEPLQLDANREKAWVGFQAKLATLTKESPPPDSVSVPSLAIAAMAKSLDEGHTSYMTAQQYKEFVAYLRGDVRYGGIGLRPRRPGVTVAEVFPGSPAEAAGLQVGDLIVSVDGQSVDGKTLEQVAQLIRGAEGTPVTLSIRRAAGADDLSFTIVRASIKLDYLSTDMIQNDIAYVRLRGFPEPSVAERFEKFLDRLPSQGVRGLIIDLRGNGGGRIDVGIRLLNRFIRSGPLFEQVDRSGQHRTQSASGPGWASPLPTAILIDEGTASMGEIFASAMREHGLARLIGKTTSGNVAAAQVYPLGDGSAIQVTVMEIYSGKGERLNRLGVQPDAVFETQPADFEAGRDTPLEAAVVYIWQASDKTASGPSTP